MERRGQRTGTTVLVRPVRWCSPPNLLLGGTDGFQPSNINLHVLALFAAQRDRPRPMDTVLSSQNPNAKRRSTRVAEAVYFTLSGIDAGGQPFVEETGTVFLSFHGCSYFS